MFRAAKRFLSREPAHDTSPDYKDPWYLMNFVFWDNVYVLTSALPKSCKGTSVKEARYTPEGLEYDRWLVIVDAKTHIAITARDINKICTVNNVIVWESNNEGYVVESLDPDAAYGPDTPSKTLSKFLGRTALPVLKGSKLRWVLPTINFPKLRASAMFHDGYPILVANDSSFEDIAKRVRMAANAEGDGEDTFKIHGLNKEVWKEKEIFIERFRPNIVISGEGLISYDEERWGDIEVGQNQGEMLLVSLCYHYQMPNIDVETGEPDSSAPSQILNKYRRSQLENPSASCFGINTPPLDSEDIRVGDLVKVVRWVKGGVIPIPPANSG
ncbi:hypothetical protein M407DRAFT_34788 [Tulasnella calospora MUT 4182]|uniref:MOSC domain-containing protein n=1 Tax=Tulasnella calospora MUT 4182 TaxID=1051891 RepID=A0A0C3Q029_9AGAM|nr:hypothetical protein M407DRAFT_34788 [Tulasnella calospora MUT 4182]